MVGVTWPGSPSNVSVWGVCFFLFFFFFLCQQEPETAPSQLLLFHQGGAAPAGQLSQLTEAANTLSTAINLNHIRFTQHTWRKHSQKNVTTTKTLPFCVKSLSQHHMQMKTILSSITFWCVTDLGCHGRRGINIAWLCFQF